MTTEDKVKENSPDDVRNPEDPIAEDATTGDASESSNGESQKADEAASEQTGPQDSAAKGGDLPATEDAEMITPEELAELRQRAGERDEMFEKLQRATADYLNFKKRKDKELDGFKRFAVQNLVEALLPPLDDFSRAIESADNELNAQTDASQKAQSFQSFLEGVRLIESQLKKVLSDFGVEPIEAVGKGFDPALHEVVVQEPSDEHPNHTVLEELQRGYLLNGRLLRPSKVKVSVEPNTSDSEEAEADVEESD